MPATPNPFKAALAGGRPQIGLWLASAEPAVAEIVAHAGFDWLVLDGEHAPNDLRSLRDQMMVVDPSPSHAVVRLPIGEAWMVKQVLDAGAQTVLVPMVDSAQEARAMARAMRYPPEGIRGMGASGGRVSGFGAIADYVQTANQQVCLIVQAESRRALENLDEILATDGVDGVFIGPADLSADMGFPGNPTAPEVQEAIARALRRIAASDKAAGILARDLDEARRFLDLGATFVAVGIDTLIFARALRQLAGDARALL
ncbi:HpcH/HpaI aldolase/citrate lyase family protein [Shimia sp.]|uniref:HpcH/HpaI aldolase family protein n=1 Tax=Shimia sp. TaxID=1954381 RepID=UPI0035693F54